MTFTPLFEAGWLIASHALAALVALGLGAAQFAAPKGTLPHRTLGYIWCALMAWVAGTSFFIFDIRMWGPFSPIHLLSALALVGLVSGVREARRKERRAHRNTMLVLFVGAQLIAGVFAFLPGRAMHEVLFGAG